MVVIGMESRQRERNLRKLKLGTWNESNRFPFLEDKNKYFKTSLDSWARENCG